MMRTLGKNVLPVSIALGLILGPVSSALQGQIVGSRELVGYVPNSDYVLYLGDEAVEEVRLFFSDKEVAYLLLSPALGAPLSLSPRGESVERIEASAVTVSGDGGSAVVAAGAAAESLADYTKFRGVIRFELDGVEARLEPTPPILGRHTPQTLRHRDRALAHGFEKARPDPRVKSRFTALKNASQQALVRVFFGSWNDFSSEVLPKIMRLEDDLAGAGVRFEYHGLGRGFTEDPVAREHSIQGLPTAIVLVDGGEVGRLKGRQLYDPGPSLEAMLQDVGLSQGD